MMDRNRGRTALALIAAMMMAGTAFAEDRTLTGEIHYLERVALPDTAVAIVQLVDVSRADAPAEILSRQVIDPAGQVPIAFALDFEAGAIAPNHRYAVEARIKADGRLLFITDTHNAVDPLAETGPLRIRLVGAAAGETGDAATLEDTNWLLTELDGTPAASGVETTLSFRADGLGGNGGCNSYGGTVVFEDGDRLAISEVFSTMMACPDPQMVQEQAYFRALDAAVSYTHADDTLTLLDAEDAPLAVFSAINGA